MGVISKRILPRSNHPGGNYQGGNFLRGKFSSGANVRGQFSLGAIFLGLIILEAIIQRAIVRGGQFPLGAIVRTPLKKDFCLKHIDAILHNMFINKWRAWTMENNFICSCYAKWISFKNLQFTWFCVWFTTALPLKFIFLAALYLLLIDFWFFFSKMKSFT